METDYLLYSQWYRYMSNIFSQTQSVSDKYSQKYAGSVVGNAENFAQTFRNTAQDLGVPESMDAIFEEAAQLYDVPVMLLKAIGKAESGFDAGAVSPAGAQGVMQLMPGTASALGVEDPFDARSNIMGGAKYISDKLKQYNGDIDLALAAYNAGSGNVEKYGGVPPFPETENYIRRIREYMGMELSADQMVVTNRGGGQNTRTGGYLQAGLQNGMSGNAGIDMQDALYLVELMRQQMQNRMMMANQSLLSYSREDSTTLL